MLYEADITKRVRCTVTVQADSFEEAREVLETTQDWTNERHNWLTKIDVHCIQEQLDNPGGFTEEQLDEMADNVADILATAYVDVEPKRVKRINTSIFGLLLLVAIVILLVAL